MNFNEKTNIITYLILEYFSGLKFDQSENVEINDRNLNVFIRKFGNKAFYPFQSHDEPCPKNDGSINIAGSKRAFILGPDNGTNTYKICGHDFPTPHLSQEGYIKAIKRDCDEFSNVRLDMALHYKNKTKFIVVGKEPENEVITGSYVKSFYSFNKKISGYLAAVMAKAFQHHKAENKRVTAIYLNPKTYLDIFGFNPMINWVDVNVSSTILDEIYGSIKDNSAIGKIWGTDIKLSELVPNDTFILKTEDDDFLDKKRMYRLGFQFEIDKIQELMAS